jgi:hypothetical protein
MQKKLSLKNLCTFGQIFHRGLWGVEVNFPAKRKAKMANNSAIHGEIDP